MVLSKMANGILYSFWLVTYGCIAQRVVNFVKCDNRDDWHYMKIMSYKIEVRCYLHIYGTVSYVDVWKYRLFSIN